MSNKYNAPGCWEDTTRSSNGVSQALLDQMAALQLQVEMLTRELTFHRKESNGKDLSGISPSTITSELTDHPSDAGEFDDYRSVESAHSVASTEDQDVVDEQAEADAESTTEDIINSYLERESEDKKLDCLFNFDNYTFERVGINRNLPRTVVEEASVSPRQKLDSLPQYARFALPRKSPKRKPSIVLEAEEEEELSQAVILPPKVIKRGEPRRKVWSAFDLDQVIYEEAEIMDPMILGPAPLPIFNKKNQIIQPDQSFESIFDKDPLDDFLSLIQSTQKVHERRPSSTREWETIPMDQGYSRRRPSEGNLLSKETLDRRPSGSNLLLMNRTSSVKIGRKRSFTLKESELSTSISRLRDKLPGSWPFNRSSSSSMNS